MLQQTDVVEGSPVTWNAVAFRYQIRNIDGECQAVIPNDSESYIVSRGCKLTNAEMNISYGTVAYATLT